MVIGLQVSSSQFYTSREGKKKKSIFGMKMRFLTIFNSTHLLSNLPREKFEVRYRHRRKVEPKICQKRKSQKKKTRENRHRHDDQLSTKILIVTPSVKLERKNKTCNTQLNYLFL